MSQQPQQGWTDQQVEQIVGNLLRAGVIASAALVLLGGILYLIEKGSNSPDARLFRGERQDLTSPPEIIQDALAGRSQDLIQAGLLLLIATPVARVLFTIFAFLRQRDYLYVGITLIVFVILLYSLFWQR